MGIFDLLTALWDNITRYSGSAMLGQHCWPLYKANNWHDTNCRRVNCKQDLTDGWLVVCVKRNVGLPHPHIPDIMPAAKVNFPSTWNNQQQMIRMLSNNLFFSIYINKGSSRQINQCWWLLPQSRVSVFDLMWNQQGRHFLSILRFRCFRTKCHSNAWKHLREFVIGWRFDLFLISPSCLGVKLPVWFLWVKKNLSPSISFLNCNALIQLNVGPVSPPPTGLSAW